MNLNKYILVVNDHYPSYCPPFVHLGLPFSHDHNLIFSDPQKVALVVFTGGSDVNPYFYGEESCRTTYFNQARDLEEIEIFTAAKRNNIPFAGICRGAQLLCVLAGGRLVQDLDGHHKNHKVVAKNPGNQFKRGLIEVSSSHHQMQYPFDLTLSSYTILAHGSSSLASHYTMSPSRKYIAGDVKNETVKQLRTEPDVVWYKSINALAAQYHPEWMSEGSAGFNYFVSLVNTYLKPRIEAGLFVLRREGYGIRNEINSKIS